jgi:hypothetical protein
LLSMIRRKEPSRRSGDSAAVRPRGTRSVYDSRRDRILLISWNRGPNVWAFDLKGKIWSNLQVKNRPSGDIYGSWDYDSSADAIVSLWPDDPAGGFDNGSGKSRTSRT